MCIDSWTCFARGVHKEKQLGVFSIFFLFIFTDYPGHLSPWPLLLNTSYQEGYSQSEEAIPEKNADFELWNGFLRSHFFTQSTRFSTDFHLSGTRKCGSSTQCIHVMFLNQFFIYFYLSLCYSLLMEDKCQATWEASSSSSSCNLATTSLNSCHVPFMLNPLHAIIFSLFYCFFMKYVKRTRNLVRYYLSLYRYATLCAKFYYVICIFFIYVVCIGYMLVSFWQMRTSISPLNVNFLAELNFQITKFKE